MQKLCLQAQQALERVRTTDAITDTERSLANIIAQEVKPDGVASIPLAEMARRLGKSKATVSRALLMLEHDGVLKKLQQRDGSHQRTNEYRFWPAYTGGDPSADTDPEA